jgi:transposase InsO family protein
MPVTYPDKLKVSAIHRYKNGESIKALSQELHISQNTLYRWRKEYCPIVAPDHTYSLTELNTLFRKLQRLEHHLEIIRQSGYLSGVPLQKKLATLEHLYNAPDNSYSVHELCDALGVARGTFYNHIFRRADRSKYEEEQAQLMLQVQQIFDDSQQRFGAEKIRFILAENGIHVGKKRIRGIMQELGLESIRENAKNDYKKRLEYQRKNLLEQNFTASRQNEIWISDITYFKIKDYGLYLCVIIDLFSRKVVGYRVSRKCSTQLVSATFRKAFRDRGNPSCLTFHSDRGPQYISGAFHTLLRKCEVKQSFSKSGCPHDNAVAEAFFSTFKREETYRHEYSSESDFRKSVDAYIDFYNHVRPHQTLAYKAPARFEDLYGKEETRVL